MLPQNMDYSKLHWSAPWSVLVKIGWFAHATVALSAFLSLIPTSPSSYPVGLVVALVFAIPLSVYGLFLAAIALITWHQNNRFQRLHMFSVLYLLPASYGIFALLSWVLYPNG